MKSISFAVLLCALLAGCGRNSNDQGSRQGTSGAGTIYSRGGQRDDDQQQANRNATDTRPRGGSMEGAGGAGPGYDGSGKGAGQHGTVPTPGSGVGAGLTNSAPQGSASSARPDQRQ